MNKIMIKTKILLASLVTLYASGLFSSSVQALPEDAKQEIIVDANSSEFDLGLGVVIHHGTPDHLVVITQGSLKITGLEVTIERLNGLVHKITATGQPARFQQQPQSDQEIMYVSAQLIAFNNTAQLLSLDGEAELIQDGDILTGGHIDYDLNTRKGNVTPGNTDSRLRMIIPPSDDQ